MESNFSSTQSTQGTSQDSAGSMGSTGGSSDNQSGGLADRARDLAGNAQEKLADVGSTVRDRAGTLKDSLADALETGADKLRARGSGQLADVSGGSIAMSEDGRMAQVNERVAGGMQATADWLRDADLDGLKTGIERQVKDHPGRSLLIAVGVGYLLGKAFRK
ncbi:MAG TPA: hypothetical protein VN706_06250 [Gemmatimonadaceae bacterium]|nr:hypothetical protein [Gemmatimonadaceae bacterium]